MFLDQALVRGFVDGKENVKNFPSQIECMSISPLLFPEQIPPQILTQPK